MQIIRAVEVNDLPVCSHSFLSSTKRRVIITALMLSAGVVVLSLWRFRTGRVEDPGGDVQARVPQVAADGLTRDKDNTVDTNQLARFQASIPNLGKRPAFGSNAETDDPSPGKALAVALKRRVRSAEIDLAVVNAKVKRMAAELELLQTSSVSENRKIDSSGFYKSYTEALDEQTARVTVLDNLKAELSRGEAKVADSEPR